MAKKTPADSSSAIDEDLVRKLAGLLDETGLNEIEYGKDGLTIRVAKHGGQGGPMMVGLPASPVATAPSVPAPAVNDDPGFADHPGALKAPMVGVVYTSPDPDSAPFVQVGDEVSEGQTLFLIEAMKVFNPIAATRAGRVSRILVNTETPVEFDEPLAIIE
ncbi:MAG: acetyl-CoA carboxylase biotin carboxyl carrier protein [Rhodospirillaceae bacterium]|nr:acetyl-CoA carboxylase biotin carboxyl carrier protein [Rhodospirillaceae bacterium]